MARSLIVSGCVNPATSLANTTQYLDIIGYTDVVAAASVDLRTGSIYDNGVFSNFKLKIITNTVNGSVVFTIQQNTVDTNQVISVPQSGSGWFEDVANTTTISDGDDVVVKAVPGGATGTYQIPFIVVLFTPSTDANSISVFKTAHATGRTGLTGASTSYYWSLNSYIDSTANTTEANVQHRIKQAGTMLGLHAYVVSNSRTTTTTVRIRKGGVSQSPTLSIGSTASGWFGDESTSFAVAVDDLIDFAIINGTGTLAITWGKIACALKVTTGTRQSTYLSQNVSTAAQGRNITRYYCFTGYYDAQTTESNAQFEMPKGSYFIAKNLNVNIRTNTVASASTLKLRKNGVDTSLSVSITSATAGYFQDVTNSVVLLEDDLIDYALTSGVGSGSQSMNVQSFGIVLEDAIDSIPNPKDIITNKILIKV